jgi:hypothetical protein
MIDQAKFKLIKEKYGHYASWAVWADSGGKPKDNIGDLSIFEIEEKDSLLRQLKPDVVLVGLNISSRSIQSPLGNFHDGRVRYSQDYKLRYALKETSLWGAYMTDIIKDFEQKASGEVMAYLRSNKSLEKDNVERFKEELRDLGVDQPTIIAFGGDAFKVLARNLGEQYDVWKMPHYSKYISKEEYRKEIGSIIESKRQSA